MCVRLVGPSFCRHSASVTEPSLFGSAVLGAFVDNIPCTAAMAPIVGLVADHADGRVPSASMTPYLWLRYYAFT
jgi:Na+/H+ antiporter NhaD/arsenite permease-like protein